MTLHQKDVQLFAKAALDMFDLKKFSIDKEKAVLAKNSNILKILSLY